MNVLDLIIPDPCVLCASEKGSIRCIKGRIQWQMKTHTG